MYVFNFFRIFRPSYKIETQINHYMDKRTINSKKARKDFADNINRVAYGHERLTITRHGKVVAALIPIEDLEFLEELEEQLDRKAIDEALEEQGDDPFKPLEEVKKELGL